MTDSHICEKWIRKAPKIFINNGLQVCALSADVYLNFAVLLRLNTFFLNSCKNTMTQFFVFFCREK